MDGIQFNNIIYSLFFYIISFILVISALGVVFLPRIVYSAIAMIASFLAVAGIFVLLNADFVAVSQVIIYAVGLTIIMIFAIMLTGADADKKLWIAFKPRTILAFGIAGVLFLLISYAITAGFTELSSATGIFAMNPPSPEVIEVLKTQGTTGMIGEQLLTKYVLPFEILSILLLAAIIGAVVLAKKNGANLVNPTTQLSEDK